MFPHDLLAALTLGDPHDLRAALIPVPIWIGAGIFAFYRKRGMLTAGFLGAGINSIPAAILAAHGTLPHLVATASLYARTPIVGLIVASFIAQQPSGAGRPPGWTF